MKQGDKLVKKIMFVSFIYNSAMIFYSLLPSVIVISISALLYMYAFFTLKKICNTKLTLVICSVISLPTSFVSVLGTNYGELPLSWFNVFAILLMLQLALFEKMDKKYLTYLLLFVLFFVVSVCRDINLVDALKQGIMMMLCFCAFIIGRGIEKDVNVRYQHCLEQSYIVSVVGFAIQIIAQNLYLSATGNVLGHYSPFRARVAYAGLFSDYSFASLYLATGIVFVLICYIEYKKIGFIAFLGSEGMMLLALLFTSARTGLFSAILMIGLYMLSKIKKSNIRYIFLTLSVLVGVPLLLQQFIRVRSGNLFDGSGRIELAIGALGVFFEKPLIGTGLGLSNWSNVSDAMIPHNFLIQYLGQLGIVGTSIVLLFFIDFIINDLSYAKYSKWLFGVTMFGSMFIPDIMSSRFLFTIVLMSIVEKGCKKRNTTLDVVERNLNGTEI